MEVQLKADLQTMLNEWAAETGRPADELIEEVMSGYFDELSKLRAMLDARYDDFSSQRVEGIDPDRALSALRAKSRSVRAARHA
jgi:hypothetical protein